MSDVRCFDTNCKYNDNKRVNCGYCILKQVNINDERKCYDFREINKSKQVKEEWETSFWD